MYYLYNITNTNNSREYVGITANFNRRMDEHRLSSSNTELKDDILKYGWAAFSKKVLVIGKKRYIENLEKAYLTKYRYSLKMYNKNNGGASNGGTYGQYHGSTELTDEEVLLIRELYFRGTETYYTLAKQFKVEASSIGKIVRGHTWAHLGGPINNCRPNSRSEVPRNKLTAEDVELIKYMYSTGHYTYVQIANELDNIVNKTAIGKIIRGERWKC